jgi:putative ATP-dependent endonuclease of OLD family
VEGFRGVRRAALELGRTSVLIGENGSGKSSLLDALALLLGAAAPGIQPSDFHRPSPGRGSGPIRIAAGLRETRPGEWSSGRLAALGEEAGGSRPGIELRFTAEPDPGDLPAGWSLHGSDGRTLDPALVEPVKAALPLIQVRGGLIVEHRGPRDEEAPAAEARSPEGAREQLERRVESHYRKLVESHAVLSPRELRAGFDAARALLERAPERLLAGALRPYGLAEEFRERQRSRGVRAGSGAQSIGLLLLLGALLEAPGSEVAAGTEPILVFEEPETHLHPLTLASVWELIEGVRLQKIVTTHSPELLSAVPLRALRRLARSGGDVTVWRMGHAALDRDERRRVRYHIRARRGGALFARCWLLIEGETEFWLLPELARLCGYDLEVEGIECVEFAQCGVAPLVKLAEQLGIGWHLLADGDHAGRSYAASAVEVAGEVPERITKLKEPDVEHCLWHQGYAEVYLKASGEPSARRRRPRSVIERAVRRSSKPVLALSVLEAMRRDGAPGIPRALRNAVEAAVRQARASRAS